MTVDLRVTVAEVARKSPGWIAAATAVGEPPGLPAGSPKHLERDPGLWTA